MMYWINSDVVNTKFKIFINFHLPFFPHNFWSTASFLMLSEAIFFFFWLVESIFLVILDFWSTIFMIFMDKVNPWLNPMVKITAAAGYYWYDCKKCTACSATSESSNNLSSHWLTAASWCWWLPDCWHGWQFLEEFPNKRNPGNRVSRSDWLWAQEEPNRSAYPLLLYCVLWVVVASRDPSIAAADGIPVGS